MSPTRGGGKLFCTSGFSAPAQGQQLQLKQTSDAISLLSCVVAINHNGKGTSDVASRAPKDVGRSCCRRPLGVSYLCSVEAFWNCKEMRRWIHIVIITKAQRYLPLLGAMIYWPLSGTHVQVALQLQLVWHTWVDVVEAIWAPWHEWHVHHLLWNADILAWAHFKLEPTKWQMVTACVTKLLHYNEFPEIVLLDIILIATLRLHLLVFLHYLTLNVRMGIHFAINYMMDIDGCIQIAFRNKM